ncbi:MAG: LPXTG cell wall anchor domain-containing protein [Oscillospiraceae bacterium]|nr:LPXTG cell wall anchor domain-containing protein [Oscillospiraceae bacterium]
MKKFIAILLAAILLIAPLSVTVLADPANTNLGNIPKTATAPVMDGVKDAIYDDGLHVPIRNPHSGSPDGGLGGGADAWLLWDDSYLYVFVQADVAGFYHPDTYADDELNNPWNLTTIEVLLDFSNAGTDGTSVCQFRLNDSGFPNVTLGNASGTWLNGDDTKPYMTTGSVKTANSYTAEYKIDYNKVMTDGVAGGMPDFGAAWGAGKQIGVYLFDQELSEDGSSTIMYVSVPTDRSGNWDPTMYDYAVLGDTVVGAAAPETTDAQAQDTAPAADTQPALVADQPSVPAAPTTGDGMPAMILVAIAVSFAGIIVFAKKRNNKTI